MKHVRIELKFYNLDTFKKQIDVNFIDLDSELVDLNYKVASLIFCHFWRSIRTPIASRNCFENSENLAQPFGKLLARRTGSFRKSSFQKKLLLYSIVVAMRKEEE